MRLLICLLEQEHIDLTCRVELEAFSGMILLVRLPNCVWPNVRRGLDGVDCQSSAQFAEDHLRGGTSQETRDFHQCSISNLIIKWMG